MFAKRFLAFISVAGLLAYFLWPRADSLSADPPKEKEPAFQKPPTTFECRPTTGTITIDGKAEEIAWKAAQPIGQFFLPWLKMPRFSKTKTMARLLWDRDYLYFFAEMEDHDLFADVTEHDGKTWTNDVFQLYFKPAVDKLGFYEFDVNAAGAVLDMYIPNRADGGYLTFKEADEFHLETKVVLKGTLNKRDDKDEGWAIEGRIPWKDFAKTAAAPNPGDRWKFALCRTDYTKDEEPEISTCGPFGRTSVPNFTIHEDYATLVFVDNPKKDQVEDPMPERVVARPYGIEKRVPLTTSTVIGSPEPAPPYRVQRVYPRLALTYPVAVALQPFGEILIVEHEDRDRSIIRRIKDEPEVSDSEVLLKVDGVIQDLAFHPEFLDTGFIYVGWNGVGGNGKRYSQVSRYSMSTKPPFKLDANSEKLILEWQSDGHNGTALCFGTDGMMYITSGDGSYYSDFKVNGQRVGSMHSKVLRIDVDRPDDGRNHAVPKDNPFVDKKEMVPETWAYGLRDPRRITCDKQTGRIWLSNSGEKSGEQVYLVRKGDNYGWSVHDGSQPFDLERQLGPTPHVKPTLEHPRVEARSLTGGIVYHGKNHAELVGAYIYGDQATGRIWAAKHDGAKVVWQKELARTQLNIAGFGVDSQGEILIVDYNKKDEGGLFTLVPTPKGGPMSKFPHKLIDSGLFASVKGHQMQPGMIPYSVNSPLWSDGAQAVRWLGLPGGDSKIDYHRTRSWTFPDQTVIVKSFAMEMEEGNPDSLRWIETQVLTKQDNEWRGYTYAWNDAQTEGTLVDGKGLDRELTIKIKAAERKQKWHYSSQAECMVCHNRGANWVLGLSEPQLNRDHNYNARVDNQLRVFDHLGLFNNFYVEKKAPSTARVPVEQFHPGIYSRLADPYDAVADLNKRAWSYLHANCAHCHNETGNGSAQFNVDWKAPEDNVKLIGVRPMHDSFDLRDSRLIAPRNADRSILLMRLATRDFGHMPPLATEIVDNKAVEMIHQWIQSMPAKKED